MLRHLHLSSKGTCHLKEAYFKSDYKAKKSLIFAPEKIPPSDKMLAVAQDQGPGDSLWCDVVTPLVARICRNSEEERNQVGWLRHSKQQLSNNWYFSIHGSSTNAN